MPASSFAASGIGSTSVSVTSLAKSSTSQSYAAISVLSSMTKRQWFTATTLGVSKFMLGMVFSHLAPFFPKEAEKKGASSAEIGLIFGIYQVVAALSSPICGKMIKHTGAKFMLLAGMFVLGVTTLLFGLLGQSPPGTAFVGLAIAVRVFQALGATGYNVAIFSIIAMEFPDQTNTFIAVVTTARSLGYAIGPVLGGALYDSGGFRLPFLVIGTLVLIAMLASLVLIPKDMSHHDEGKAEEHPNISYMSLLKSTTTLVMLMATIISALGPSILEPTLEPQMRTFHLSHGQVGFLFLILGIASLTSSMIFGYLTDKYGIGKQVMAAGGLLSFFAYFLLGPAPFTHLPDTIWLTGISIALAGFAMSMQFIPVFGLLNHVAISKGFPDSHETNGLVSGLFQSCFSAGFFLGPLLGSVGQATIGFGWTSSIVALIELISGTTLVLHIFCRQRTNSELLPLRLAVE